MKHKTHKHLYGIWMLALALCSVVLLAIESPVAERGNVEDFLAYLDKAIPESMEKHDIAGVAVGLIHDGEVVRLEGYGHSDASRQVPVTENTVFQVASISKPLTAWGIMNLVEEGRLELDTPVSQYLTRWALPPSKFDEDEVTLRRLLSHSAGIAHVGGYAGFSTAEDVQILEESLSSPLDADSEGVRIRYRPGTGYHYSGGGYTLLQLAIEETTGMPFEAYMKREILEPLGMTQSDFVLSSSIAKHLSVVYDKDDNVAPSRLFTAKAAAGLYTTAKDLTSWAAAMMPSKTHPQGGNVLKPETLESMFIPQAELNNPLPYGLGYMVQSIPAKQLTEVAHTGSNLPGWHALVSTIPETGAGIVLLTNSPGGAELQYSIRHSWLHWATGSSTFALRLEKFVRILTFIVPVGIAGTIFIFAGTKIMRRNSKLHIHKSLIS